MGKLLAAVLLLALGGCAASDYCRLPDRIVKVGAQPGQFAGQVVDIAPPQKGYVDIAMAFFYDNHVYTGLRRCFGPRCLDLKVNDFVLFQCTVGKTVIKPGLKTGLKTGLKPRFKYRWHCKVLAAARPPKPK